jgi:ketosteroid isomerase-like protein
VQQAINAHDLEALAACFHVDYDSTFPAHPERAFKGQAQMRKNWEQIFAAVPDITSALLQSATVGKTVWAEWEWRGTRRDGAPFVMRGVTIQEVHDGEITSVRMYMEPVQAAGPVGDAALRQALGETAGGYQ